MSFDSFTPPIEWREQSSLHASTPTSSTCFLVPFGILPKQELANHSDHSSSSWSNEYPVDEGSTQLARRPRTISSKVSQPYSSLDEVVLLKKWTGFVLKTLSDGFVVRFEEGDSGEQPIEAEFDIDELHESDKAILAEGMPVVWCISREVIKGGKKHCSSIYIRRQSAPAKADISAAARNLDEWFAPSAPTTCS
jgi:hypothetical protein